MGLDEKLLNMFMENTGKHLLDSGGENGRHWQQNRKFGWDIRKWLNRPNVYCDISKTNKGLCIDCTIDTFQFLRHKLHTSDKAETMEKQYKEWAKEYHDIAFIETFLDFYGYEYIKDNTFNYEPSFTQDFEFTYLPSEHIVIIELHNGCDIRGGYTQPRFFYLNDVYSLLPSIRFRCNECYKEWEYDYNDTEEFIYENETLKHKNCGGEIEWIF